MAEETTNAAPAQAPVKEEKCRGEGKKSCKRPVRAKGYCGVHYKKWRRGELPKSRYTRCHKEGCRKPMGLLGLCDEHRAPAAPKEEAAKA